MDIIWIHLLRLIINKFEIHCEKYPRESFLHGLDQQVIGLLHYKAFEAKLPNYWQYFQFRIFNLLEILKPKAKIKI